MPFADYAFFTSLGLGLIIIVSVAMRCINKRRERAIQLRAPLLPESTDHRLDAALREAEDGYNVCTACGFENFKRLIFCTICGTAIVTAASEKKNKKRWWRAKVEEPIVVNNGPSQRQRRARMRKEWQRKVDVEGNMFWYREGVESAQPSTYPGYVLRMTSEVETDKDVNEAMPLEERAKNLAETLIVSSLEWTEASNSDPSQLSFNLASLSDEDKRDTLTLFTQTFPAKYVHLVTSASMLLNQRKRSQLKLNVNRDKVFEDSLALMNDIATHHMHGVMRIIFIDETGVDAGGVHREWLQLLFEKLVDPNTGLFTCTNRAEQTYYLNPHSKTILGDNHLAYFFSTGRLLGRAFLEGYVTGFHFALPLLKIILGLPVSFSDLEFFDPEAYQGLKWLLDNNGVEHLSLDFTVCEQVGDEMVIVELLPDGGNIEVTDENKRQYVDLKLKYLLFGSVSSQLYALLQGFYHVIPPHVLMCLDPEELDYVLCGSDEIDVDDWERNTKYTEDLHDHPCKDWFWELVREMPNEYRRRLLIFATGSSRVPLAGFCALTSYDGKLSPFTLKGIDLNAEGYIVSHACFNRLDLPRHVSPVELKTVLYAILDTELYGFTTD
ncbi:hypothetical protein Poli38472_003290 [Pythium oligandrum]|uniref:HECT-type E3 ubiquitin transferase n=1 Tax=Pythium oligandrum TaxID=41045 RepID=A0A8K1C6R9_PYTOL|nr:hypothetical protein Poli38472_003290 [Pythium oligandrum]|eukprot:TMW57365.1 hypothetical protein Poli38472_003290 [Pythium oligandrum]